MKKAIVFLLCFCASAYLLLTAGALATAENNSVAIFINGESFAPPAPMVVKDGITFVPIRDFCEKMNPNVLVLWDESDKSVTITLDGLCIEVTNGQKYMTANGRYLYIPNGCFMLDDNTMVPVRHLAKAFGASVSWDADNRIVNITQGDSLITPADDFYDDTDLHWLSRIIYAESGGEPLEGQIGVGNVVLNRVASDLYPDSIHDVIFDTLYGVQFTPVADGAINKTPSEKSIIAAKLVLDGAEVVGNSLFFLNEAIAVSKWIVLNRDFVITIGGHSFYA